MLASLILRTLGHPLTRGRPLDDPLTTELRNRIIREKGFLRKLYGEWQARLASRIPVPSSIPGKVIELGSGGGGGLIKDAIPDCLTTELFPCPGVDLVCDARRLPFADGELRGIVMTDVLHHVPEVHLFLDEASRALAAGGVIAMLEPWNTWFSRLVYGWLHPEPFNPEHDWSLDGLGGEGPLTKANGALPWILFARDRERFDARHPGLSLVSIELDYPFSYLASGGVSCRALAPGWSFGPVRSLEKALFGLERFLALFAMIVLKKKEPGA